MVDNGGPLKCVCGGRESPKGIGLNVPQGYILGPLLLLNGVLQGCVLGSLV